MISPFYDKVFALYIGRDINYETGWRLSLLIVPRRDLTREGYLILAGLAVEVSLWRRPLLTVRSDADRIARQIERRANLGLI